LAARVLQHSAGFGEQRDRALGALPDPRERVRAAQPGGGLRVGRARAVAPAQGGGGQRGDQEDGLWRACHHDRAVARPEKGRRRTGRPSSASQALATAGAIGGTPGSPAPVGGAADGTMCTSTRGISSTRRMRESWYV